MADRPVQHLAHLVGVSEEAESREGAASPRSPARHLLSEARAVFRPSLPSAAVSSISTNSRNAPNHMAPASSANKCSTAQEYVSSHLAKSAQRSNATQATSNELSVFNARRMIPAVTPVSGMPSARIRVDHSGG